MYNTNSEIFNTYPEEISFMYFLWKKYDVSLSKLESLQSLASRKTLSRIFNDKSYVNIIEEILKEHENGNFDLQEMIEEYTFLDNFMEFIQENYWESDYIYSFGGDVLKEEVLDDDEDEELYEDAIEQWETVWETVPEDINYIVTKKSISLTCGDETRTVNRDSSNYDLVRQYIVEDDLISAWEQSSVKDSLIKASYGLVEIEDNKIFFSGVEIKNKMVDRIFAILEREGAEYVNYLAAFADKCLNNNSFRAVNELLGFMEKNTLPICSDGDFLAYKKVNDNYRDVHSGTVPNVIASNIDFKTPFKCGVNDEVVVDKCYDNLIGDDVTVVSTERFNVDDNCNKTCSIGLHVCSYDYLGSFFGDNVMVCKINPRDVVSVPVDYNNAKMRVCDYKIIGEIDEGEQVNDLFVTDEYFEHLL